MAADGKIHMTLVLEPSLHARFRKHCFDLGTSMKSRLTKLVEADC